MGDLAHPIELLDTKQRAILSKAASEKIQAISTYDHATLLEYTMVLLSNKKTQAQIATDLGHFLGPGAKDFVAWVWAIMEDIFLGREVVVATPTKEKKDLSQSQDKSPGRYRERSPLRSSRGASPSRSRSPSDRYRDRRPYQSRSPPRRSLDRRSPDRRYRDRRSPPRRSPPPHRGGPPPERRNHSPDRRNPGWPREDRNRRGGPIPWDRERPEPKRRERPASPAWSHDKYSAEVEKPQKPEKFQKRPGIPIVHRDDPSSWEPVPRSEQPREEVIKASTKILGIGLAKKALGSVTPLPTKQQQSTGLRISRDSDGVRRMIVPTGGMRADDPEYEGTKIIRAAERPKVVEPPTKKLKTGEIESWEVIQIDDDKITIEVEQTPPPPVQVQPSNVKFTVTISTDLENAAQREPRITATYTPEDERTAIDLSDKKYVPITGSYYPQHPHGHPHHPPKIHRSSHGVRKPPFRNQTLILKPPEAAAKSDSASSEPTTKSVPPTIVNDAGTAAAASTAPTPAGTVFRSRNKNMVYIPPRPS